MPNDISPIFVRYEPGRVSLSGGVDQAVVITAQNMLNHLLETASQRSIDLIAIAAGVYTIDRVCKRKISLHNECGVRTHRIVFEVSDFEFWSHSDIQEKLTEILCFLTGDTWLLSFAKRSEQHQTSSAQKLLDLKEPSPTSVALFSGGLDSAAGLANRLISTDQTYMLLTVGHHVAIRSKCRSLVEILSRLLRAPMLHHASFIVRFDGGVAGKMKLQETSQRARGFLFSAAAAILAGACFIKDIEIFENGVGAINLPLTEGGMTDGLSTRGCNPGLLEKLSRFFSDVLDRPIRFSLPFLYQTKGEMIRGLVQKPYVPEWLQQSSSCIHSSLRVSGKRHCGQCPACIERRQAFHAAGISENASDYQVDLFRGGLPKDLTYFMSYLENARWWSSGNLRVESRLARHQILSNFNHLPFESFKNLLYRHASESLFTYGDIEFREAA